MKIKFFYAVLLFFAPFVLEAAFDDRPPCYKRFEVYFFEPDLVMQALSLYNVEQSRWSVIAGELQRRSFKIPEVIKSRAKRLRPNPLEYPFQKEAAGELLLGALFEVFSEVLVENAAVNLSGIRQMFEYIRSRHGSAFQDCAGQGLEKKESASY